MPVDGRSEHPDDADAARPLSLCRHTLVLHDVRPGRTDHGDADAVDDPRIARGVLRTARGVSGDGSRCRSRTPSRARSFTRCEAEKWPRCGEVPFERYYGSVDSTPLFVLLAALYVERTGDSKRSDECGRRSSQRWVGSMAPAIWMATASSSIGARSEQGLANQGWKDCSRRIFHADGRWPRADRAVRGSGLRICRQAIGGAMARVARLTEWLRALERAAEQFARRFEDAFWCLSLAHTLWRSMARSNPAKSHIKCRAIAVHRYRVPERARGWSPPI